MPHSCAFCAQEWDSTEASRVGFVLHVILGGAALSLSAAITFAIGLTYVAVNFLTDLLYSAVNPRIRQ